MKLAALGLVTAVFGIVWSEPGLIGIGAYWVLLGPLMWQHGKRLKALQSADPATGKKKPLAIDGRTFALGTALWLALGVPSLLVGILEPGLSAEHQDWRWLPFGVGCFALGIGGISALLYLLGSGVQAYADRGPEKKTPATIWISSVKETGTYINERPRLEFELRVEPDAGTGVAGYEVTKKATVPFTAMGSLKPGDGFRADVAGPEDPTAMDIHWDEPVAGTGSGDVTTRLDALEKLRAAGSVSDEEYRSQRERILGSL